MEVRPARRDELPAVVALLRASGFPNLPAHEVAEAYLAQRDNLVIMRNDEIVGWVCPRRTCGNAAVLDICIARKWQKRWCSRGLLRKLVHVIFEDMKFNMLLAEGFSASGMQLASALGFERVPGSTCLRATREMIEGKLRMNG